MSIIMHCSQNCGSRNLCRMSWKEMKWNKILFLNSCIYFCVWMCADACDCMWMHMHVMVHMWRSGEDIWFLVLSFYHVCLGVQFTSSLVIDLISLEIIHCSDYIGSQHLSLIILGWDVWYSTYQIFKLQ